MEILDAQQTAALLPYPALMRGLRDMLRAKRAGEATAPQRTALPIGASNSLLVMPAVSTELVAVKLVTVHPLNRGYGLPSVQADLLVLDAETGRRLYLLDGETVTARRTAALSVLAAELLAPVTTGPLLVVGAGTQGRAHVEAFVEGLGVHEVYLASRTPEAAEQLAIYARTVLGVAAHVVPDAAPVLGHVPLVVTATTSRSPVIGDAVRTDAFVAAVGAYTADMAELPAVLVRRSRLFVDVLEGAQTEAGDLLQAGVQWGDVTPIENVVERDVGLSGRPTIFKSVGYALWDLAAAQVIHATWAR